MAILAEGLEQGDQKGKAVLIIDAGDSSAGELDAQSEIRVRLGWCDFSNEEGRSGPFRGLLSNRFLSPAAPGSEGRILDSAMSRKGLTAHSALLESGQDLGFVFGGVSGAARTVGFNDGVNRSFRRR